MCKQFAPDTSRVENSEVAPDARSARTVLARHPIAVECVRAASQLTGLLAEIVVFESDRAFIVASSTVARILIPRHLNDAEEAMISQASSTAESDSATTFSFTDGGEIVGALTTHGPLDATAAAVVGSSARIITGLLAERLESNATFETAVIEGLRDPVIVLTPELNVRWANRAVGSLLGRTPAEMVGKSGVEFLHPDDVERTFEAVISLQQGRMLSRIVVRLSRGDGEYERVELTGVDHTDHPLIQGMVLSARSADREGELERSIDRSEAMGDAIVGGLNDALVATDEFGDLTTVNNAARAMFGIDEATPLSALSLDNFELFDPTGRRRPINDDPATVEATGRGQANERELCVVAGPDEFKYVSLDRSPVHGSNGELIGSVLVFHDLTTERTAEAELRSQALHDQLTGLPNRRQLEQRIAELSSQVDATQVAAIFIDLDGFKLVNDTHGHRIGDHLIRIASTRLQSVLRTDDLLVRQGGDEFVVLHPNVPSIEVARETAERLRVVLAEPYEINDLRFDITASLGVAMAMSNELADEMVLQQADIALYAAKADGRDRVEIFNDDLADAVSLEERQRRILRSALENDRLVMHFQPLVHAGTGYVSGYEALARVCTEEGELIGPGGFMEAVTSTGLIWDLDRAGFELSCQAAAVLAELEPENPPTIACNFSPFSLAQPGFIDFVVATAAKHVVNPNQIWIEITESAAFDGGAQNLRTLTDLNAAGFRLALDDFGTGYSSLAHLRDLPISSVKVDRSFVSKLGNGRSERVIAEAVVTLAQDLGLDVVAEGVETAEHLDNVRQLGFSTVQGWHYAPAMPLTEAIAARQRSGVARAAES